MPATMDDFDNVPTSDKASKATPTKTPATNGQTTNYNSELSSLLNWENPKNSAMAVTSIVSLIFLVRYLDIIRYSLKLTWMVLGTTVAAEVLGKATTGNGLAQAFAPRKYFTLSEDTLNSVIGDVHELVNFFIIEAQRILYVENVSASIGAFVAAFMSYYAVKVIPYWGLALIFTAMAFSIPILYTTNQELIDSQIKSASDVLDTQTRQIREVAGKHTAHATEVSKQYLGDYTSKAQAMLRGKSSEPAATAKPAAPSKSFEDADFPSVPKEDLKAPEVMKPDESVEIPDVPVKDEEDLLMG